MRSPHEPRTAILVTILLMLLAFALLPLWGPHLSRAEGSILPVVSEAKVISAEREKGGLALTIAFTKLRFCESISFNWRQNDQMMFARSADGERSITYPLGTALSRWHAEIYDTEDITIIAVHRCHPFWLTETMVDLDSTAGASPAR